MSDFTYFQPDEYAAFERAIIGGDEAAEKTRARIAALEDAQARAGVLTSFKNPAMRALGASVGPAAGDAADREAKHGAAAGAMAFAKLRASLGKQYVGDRTKLGQTAMRGETAENVALINKDARLGAAQIGADATVTAAGIRGANNPDEVSPIDKKFIEFSNKFNPHIASMRSPLGLSQAIMDRAARVKTLPESQDFRLDPQEVHEFAMGLATVINGGGSGGAVAVRTVEALKPHSWRGDWASFLQYVTAHPEDAGAIEFTKRMYRTLNRESERVKGQTKEAIKLGARGYAEVLRRRPLQFSQWANQVGMSEDEIADILALTDGPTAPAAAAPSISNGVTAGEEKPNVGKAPVAKPAAAPAKSVRKFKRVDGKLVEDKS